MDRTAYKNRHIKEHYDRINFVIPKGEKDRIKKICSEIGASVNEYLYMLVCNDLVDGISRIAQKKQGFNAEQQRILEKWQVPRKYYEMIEDLSYTKDEGYFIYLKKGYVNDVTGNRNIHCMNTLIIAYGFAFLLPFACFCVYLPSFRYNRPVWLSTVARQLVDGAKAIR